MAKANRPEVLMREARLGEDELRQGFIAITSVAFMVLCYCGWLPPLYKIVARTNIVENQKRFVVFFFAFCQLMLAYRFRSSRPIVSHIFYLLSLTLTPALALRFFGHPLISYFYLIAVIAGFAVSPLLGAGAVVFSTISLLLSISPGPYLYTSLPLLWLMGGIQFVYRRSQDTALQWAWNSHLRATDLLNGLRDRQGKLNRTMAALTEATRRLQRTNQELGIARQEAEQARTLKGQFVANVSHELRTPLNLIVGFVEMMYLAPESYEGVCWTADLESDLRIVHRASRHLESLVNDVLDLSRLEADRLPMFRELQDIRPIIDDAAATVAPLLERRGLTLKIDCPEDLPLLFVDRTRIQQVLINLLNNAVRFTDYGGVTVRIEQSRDAIVAGVHDTGIGIRENQLEKIFEEFQRADPGPRGRGGVGLGLAISRRFVELHSGRMWAESVVGEGSSFYFAIPLPGAVPQSASLERSPRRVLEEQADSPIIVVDPNLAITDMLARYFSDGRVLSARSIGEAEADIEKEHPIGIIVNEQPTATDSDWVGRLGEYSERYNVPILRCHIPNPSWLQQTAGFADCLTKPVSREVITTTVTRLCNGPSTILVVDDDAEFVSLVVRWLGMIPVAQEVLWAYTGLQALRLAKEKRPDLVLLDLAMPDMDGFEVLEALHDDPSLMQTPVVAVTAASYAEEALLGRGQYLTLTQSKGISTEVLLKLLDAVLHNARPSYV